MTKNHLAFAFLGLAACTSATSHHGVPQGEAALPAPAVGPVAQPATPDAPPASFAEGNADFAVDMLRALAQQNANHDVFFSPYALEASLAMTYAGARGDTATEMRSALRLGATDADLAGAYGRESATLATRTSSNSGRGVNGTMALELASSLWGRGNVSYEQPFLDELAQGFQSPLQLVDFAGDPSGASTRINQWVSTKTAQQIPTLDPGAVDASSELVVVSAASLDAEWQNPIPPATLAPFTAIDGALPSTLMITAIDIVPAAAGAGYQAVLFPYSDPNLAMLFVVPDAGTITSFEASLTGAQLLSILDSVADHDVRLTFPEVRLGGDYELTPELQALGMKRAFDAGAADFDGLSAGSQLPVSRVLHRTALNIGQRGTATASEAPFSEEGGSGGSGSTAAPMIVHADHPFIVAVVDRPTRTLLFLGHVVAPAAAAETACEGVGQDNTSSSGTMGPQCNQPWAPGND